MIREAECHFLEAAHIAHLASADGSGAPHVVPVCFALDGAAFYVTVDDPVALATASAEESTLPLTMPARRLQACLACQ